jgi:hypothetical protein
VASKFLENILTPYLRVCSTDSGILHECRIGQGLAGCDRDLREERSLQFPAGSEENYEKCESGCGTSPRDSNEASPRYKFEALCMQLVQCHDPGDHKNQLLLILLNSTEKKLPS